MSLEKEIVELLKGLGAVRVGFANLETLAGSPPSADLKYIMPEARSAVSFTSPSGQALAHSDGPATRESRVSEPRYSSARW